MGDRLHGRQTLPIVWPEASRTTILFLILAWSFGLPRLAAVDPLYATVFFGSGVLVGLRFYFKRDVDSDRLSYDYYNVGMLTLDFLREPDSINQFTYQAWLTIAQVIHTPVIMRLLS